MIKKCLIIAMLLSLPISVVAYTGQTYYAKNLQVEVKAGPSEDSKTKFIIAMGRKVIEFNKKKGWVQCDIYNMGGKDGWIRVKDLSIANPDSMKSRYHLPRFLDIRLRSNKIEPRNSTHH